MCVSRHPSEGKAERLRVDASGERAGGGMCGGPAYDLGHLCAEGQLVQGVAD